jgi:hypothetical protein
LKCLDELNIENYEMKRLIDESLLYIGVVLKKYQLVYKKYQQIKRVVTADAITTLEIIFELFRSEIPDKSRILDFYAKSQLFCQKNNHPFGWLTK